MTVTYTAEVATSQRFGTFLKLLFRWRGSIYKLVWVDLIIFLSLYYTLSLLYRTFEGIVRYCFSYGSLIPLSFVLGFYVQIVMQRWWDQYINIPWPDTIAVLVSAHVQGQDERGRLMRRTVMRYVNLCQTIVLTMISPRARRRFPKLENLVEAGLLMESEKTVIQIMDESFPKHPKYWMPIVWAASIVSRARREGRIRDDIAVKTIIDELNKFRGYCGVLLYYDFISIPLVYTQVVTLAVYSYFLCNVVGKQWTRTQRIEGYPNLVDNYFPIFALLQFFFYMGWLKVAESLINPFGEDDDDFEVNWMIDRNVQVSYLIVDEMHHEHPELVKDQYWDEIFPNELPYGDDTTLKREEPPEPSTAKIAKVPSLSEVRVEDNSRHARFTTFLGARSDADIDRYPRYTSSDISHDLYQSSSQRQSINMEESEEEEETEYEDDGGEPPDEKDPFEQLREERERERTIRQVKNITRSLGNAATILDPDATIATSTTGPITHTLGQDFRPRAVTSSKLGLKSSRRKFESSDPTEEMQEEEEEEELSRDGPSSSAK